MGKRCQGPGLQELEMSPKPLDTVSHYVQSPLSQEEDTSKVSSGAGGSCYGSHRAAQLSSSTLCFWRGTVAWGKGTVWKERRRKLEPKRSLQRGTERQAAGYWAGELVRPC